MKKKGLNVEFPFPFNLKFSGETVVNKSVEVHYD